MAVELDCPLEECHRVIRAPDADLIMEEVATHADEAHPDVGIDEDTYATLRSTIQEV